MSRRPPFYQASLWEAFQQVQGARSPLVAEHKGLPFGVLKESRLAAPVHLKDGGQKPPYALTPVKALSCYGKSPLYQKKGVL